MKSGINRIFVLVMVFLLVLTAGCEATAIKMLPATQYDIDNTLTAEQMKQDLDYLEAGLEYYHADAWHSISKADFETALAEVESRLDGMTRTQFQYEVSRLVGLIGDAHTSASSDARYGSYLRELPFGVKDFDDGWYITKTDAEHKDFLGWRIDKIGKFDTAQVVEMVKPYFSTETESWTRYKMCSCLNNWDLFFMAGVVNTETVTLTLSKDGETKKTEYTALPHPDCYDLCKSVLESMDGYIPLETGESSDYYRMIEFANFLFVQYNVCKDNPAKSMEKFAAELTELQAEKNYRNLVIDLRYNTGGNSSVSEPLRIFTEAFVEAGGNFYLLVGEKTFSSGMLTVTNMRKYNPLLIGIPTGGGENHYGNIQSTIVLKNSGVRVACATSWFQVLADPAVASATPDIVVQHTFDDYFNGIDPEMEIVKKLISGEMATPVPENVELVSGAQSEQIDLAKYPWANNMSGGFTGYVGPKRVMKWVLDLRDRIDPMPMAYAKEFDLTPEELVAVMRYDTALRANSGRQTEYYTEEDIKSALIYVYGSADFNETEVPDLDFNIAREEFWSLYGTEPIENMEALGASVENAIPWSFVTEIGIRNYLIWANGLSDKSEYTLQNFLKYCDFSVVAYDDVFNRLKQAGESFYSDSKIAEIRTEVYGY